MFKCSMFTNVQMFKECSSVQMKKNVQEMFKEQSDCDQSATFYFPKKVMQVFATQK